MSTYSHSSRRIHPDTLKIDSASHPGWESGTEHTFSVGEQVYCTEGLGEVIRVLGRTQNGSRLLELRLADGRRESFFAAASNVLIALGAAVAR